ncbi:ATP-binding protein [Metabacillus bambusae]|uniref:histidine kinase n=1 Tax=Metabacillus bambusae TaxID=2795218 RepID=A0ABS3N461_9BACI|nr:ATP-binding protein [Metabacillus bambusae]MBO1512989.1 PAS domain-containing sensor histidine kinase [Metabacillus bambusae]
MLLRKLLQDQDKFIIISTCSIGLIGIVSLLLQIQISIAILIAIIMVIQLVLIIDRSRQRSKMAQKVFLDDIPLPIIITDNEKLLDLNTATVFMFGAKDKYELIGRAVNEFITFLERGNNSLHVENFQHAQLSIKGKINCINGRVLDIELISSVRSNELNGRICYVIKDISEYIESEKKLQHSEQLSVLGELAAGIAHEIRNPLTSLKGFLQLSTGTEKNREIYNNIMLSEINRINLIVGELLLLSKPKEMVFQPSHLLSLIRTVVTIVNTQAILYNIEIITEIDHEVQKLNISCEENKLKQVFINILKNGIEAMQIEGKMYIKVKRLNNDVHISFIDEGKGIPEEELERLGKRFYSTKENGTGLGLMISFNIIENHKGKMNISSKVGKGTVIDIVLPV